MIGQTLSHFKITAKLGEGGMGEVYLAEDTTLDRQVALKVLPAGMSGSAERLQRFRREARAVAALNHPNIVTIHSVEEDKGVHFLTMEFVEGTSLDRVIPRGGMALGDLFDIAVPLADALSTAHQKGIVHRDLKPSNIMLSDEGRIKVLDFGLAKLTGAQGGDNATSAPTEEMTAEGVVMGTLPYMSPEQVEGKPVDARSDVFSLGTTLYEIATGQRPFHGQTTAALTSSILRDTPHEIDLLRGDLPHHLARIVRCCLQKDPERRYTSAREVWNELEELRREEDSSAALAVGRELMTTARAKTRPSLWIGLSAGLSLIALIFMLLSRHDASSSDSPPGATTVEEQLAPAGAEPPMIVVLPFDNLGPAEDAYFAAGVTEEITSRLAAVRDLGVISRTSAVEYDTSGKTIRKVGADLGVDYVLEGTVRWSRPTEGPSRVLVTPRLVRVAADTNLWSERYDKTLDDIFAVQAQIAEQVVMMLQVTLSEPERNRIKARATDNLEAYQAYLRGMENISRSGSLAEQEWGVAIRMFERAVDLDPGFAQAYARLSWARSGEQWVAPRRLHTESQMALQAAEKALALDPDLPEAHAALGRFYYWFQRDYDLALQHLGIAARGLSSDSEIFASTAAIHRRKGDWGKALRTYRHAAVIDPRSSEVALDIAHTLTLMRRYEEAEEEYARSLSIAPDQAVAYFFRSQNQVLWKGDLKTSRAILEQAPVELPIWSDYRWYRQLWLERDYRSLLQRLNGSRLADQAVHGYLYSRLWAAAAHQALGDRAQARAAFEAASVEMERLAEEFPEDVDVRIALAEAYAGLGRRDDAVREARRALELGSISKDALSAAQAQHNMAHIYLMVGEFDTALELIDQQLSVPSLVSVEWLRLDPTWDPLRDDRRFQALLEKYD